MKLLFCIFAGGRPGYLANFPQKIKNKSNLNWVHGLHKVFEVFSGFAYEIVFLYFAGGSPRVLSKFPPKSFPKHNLNWVHGFHRVLDAVSGFG